MEDGRWMIKKEPGANSLGVYYMYEYEPREFCSVWVAQHIHPDNVNLIAAAPDLYEAIIGLLDGLDSNSDERCGLKQEEWEKRIQKARKALSLAESGLE